MTVKQNKRIFRYAAIGFICVAAVVLCLTSCRLYGSYPSSDAKDDAAPSTQEDAYQAKILYYEAQLNSLSSQLNDMEQQMYLLREDCLNGLRTLEQRITDEDDGEEQQIQTPATGDEISDTSTTPEAAPEQAAPSDHDGQAGEVCEYTYELKNNFAILTAYKGSAEHVVVPGAVDGYMVIALADRTFAESGVRSVTLPETIESIGWFTFYGCENLEKVTLPAKLSSIGYASFDGCASALCLYVYEDSYAEKFANSFGLNCQMRP